MVGRTAFDLDTAEIVDAAVDILTTQGLAAVSMRNVGARLGVSPQPLYSRVGNKAALLDAVAARVLAGVAPAVEPDEPWRDYAERWAYAVRAQLARTTDVWLVIGDRRSPFVEATRPLIDTLRAQGFASDAAVQTCRLLLWAVVGFVTVERGRAGHRAPPARRRRPGGDPAGVTRAEADHLFALHLGYLLDGIDRDRDGVEGDG